MATPRALVAERLVQLCCHELDELWSHQLFSRAPILACPADPSTVTAVWADNGR